MWGRVMAGSTYVKADDNLGESVFSSYLYEGPGIASKSSGKHFDSWSHLAGPD